MRASFVAGFGTTNLLLPHLGRGVSGMARAVHSCFEDRAQDIAEYAVMLAVILVIVVGTIRLVGTNANNVFSSVASSVQ
jgi:Flp pilus assembly pilin Flp